MTWLGYVWIACRVYRIVQVKITIGAPGPPDIIVTKDWRNDQENGEDATGNIWQTPSSILFGQSIQFCLRPSEWCSHNQLMCVPLVRWCSDNQMRWPSRKFSYSRFVHFPAKMDHGRRLLLQLYSLQHKSRIVSNYQLLNSLASWLLKEFAMSMTMTSTSLSLEPSIKCWNPHFLGIWDDAAPSQSQQWLAPGFLINTLSHNLDHYQKMVMLQCALTLDEKTG